MRQYKITLYKYGANGLSEYKIWNEENEIHIIANSIEYVRTVEEGKAGRSLEEQVKLVMKSRIKVKMDEGFKKSKEEALKSKNSTNQLGLYRPMLANRLDKFKGALSRNVFIQPKLDGHRCLINKDMAYSRRGLPIPTIDHITDSLAEKFKAFPNVTLDGELYIHGVPLQTISSYVKRKQPKTSDVQFHIYDCIIHDDLEAPYIDRLGVLDYFTTEHVKIVSTKLIPKSDIYEFFTSFVYDEYEGAIVRIPVSKYAIGKRSNGLLKVKQFAEEEFECIGLERNALNWAILAFKTPDGKTFSATAPGTVDDKIAITEDQAIGKLFTIQFANYTKDGIPFQPSCLRIREDL